MKMSLLTKKQFSIYLGVCVLVTAPFFAFAMMGELDNEGVIGLMLPFMGGLPWVLIYLYLPFDIPGATSPGVPDETGDLSTSVLIVFLVFLPVYLNIFLAFLFVTYDTKILKKNDERRNKADDKWNVAKTPNEFEE